VFVVRVSVGVKPTVTVEYRVMLECRVTVSRVGFTSRIAVDF